MEMKKLAGALVMLSKVKYIMVETLKNLCHAIHDSHCRYGCKIWFLSNSKFIKGKLEKSKKKALRTIFF